MSDVNTDTGVILEALNNKVDLDGNNLSVQGKSLISGLGMPSIRYSDLTLLASDSTYTAPANGWFCFQKVNNTSASRFVSLKNLSNNLLSCSWGPFSANDPAVYIPARKGDVVKIQYDCQGETKVFRFIYAEGEN